MRREYKVKLTVNKKSISKVIIDDHYEENHSESIDDDIILKLVKDLDNRLFEPIDNKTPFKYFLTDSLLNDKPYRLIWLLEEDNIYIGVINAYRRSE
ncbi:MAG: hypothetical protein KAG61_03185 [Bacteriovoracaceae bacterium]|nr:hypothetical protein [Bacteriovoracaceae bacterium]